MKYLRTLFVVVSCLVCFGCAPKWLVVNSSGIATYNRHTGQFEILWENKSAQREVVHDTIYVDCERTILQGSGE